MFLQSVSADVVIIPSCTDSHIPGAFRSPTIPLPVGAMVAPGVVMQSEVEHADNVICSVPVTRSQHEAQSRRLLATAMSRAKHCVLFTSVGPAQDSSRASHLPSPGHLPHTVSEELPAQSARSVKRSRWLDVLFPGPGTAPRPLGMPGVRSGAGPSAVLSSTPPRIAAGSARKGSTAPLLELSFSSLFDYQWCPHRYYLRKVVGLPSFPSPAMSYGTGESCAHVGFPSP
jgi:hypothetical protein